jgi:AcrR family transcriptional regulator
VKRAGARASSLHARGIERRRRLVESARALLATHDLHRITLGQVAAHAEVPKGSAYFFYSDIEDLYASLQSVVQEELLALLSQPIRGRIHGWPQIIAALNERGMQFYSQNPAARQLQIGPHTSADLKRRDRQSDIAIGRVYENHVDAYFTLPPIPERSRVFFRAVEIADLMFCLSVLESGVITDAMCAEAHRACIAYLKSYLPATLPKRRAQVPGA